MAPHHGGENPKGGVMEDEVQRMLRAVDDDPGMRGIRQRMSEQDDELAALRELLGENEQL